MLGIVCLRHALTFRLDVTGQRDKAARRGSQAAQRARKPLVTPMGLLEGVDEAGEGDGTLSCEAVQRLGAALDEQSRVLDGAARTIQAFTRRGAFRFAWYLLR